MPVFKATPISQYYSPDVGRGMGEDGVYRTCLPQGLQWRKKLQQGSQKCFPAQLLEVRELLQDAEGTLNSWQAISWG